jgi:CheY-like chemotaxis protein
LGARLKGRDQVLALLSHEMRTPLNGVLGMAGLLAATKLDATQRAYLGALRDSGELLLSLVNDILDLAKLDSRPLELEPVDTDVERLLQGVCELLSPRAYSAGIEIAWSTLGRLPRLRADDGRLRQILFNLAGNAIKLTQSGGVLVTAAQVGETAAGRIRVRFSVKDTGPGVPEAFQTRIFEEFVQTEAGAQAGGAGLGLAIVKRLAAAFEGELGLISPPGEGADFWFEADFALAPIEPGAQDGAKLSLAGRRVAVVSANPIVRQAARMQIETCGGQTVDAPPPASTTKHRAVAVLIDPDPTAPPAPPSVGAPTIVLLAPEARDRIEAFRAAGYAGYLIKPLRRASLAARVLAVLGEPGLAPTPFADANAPADDERADDERASGGPPESLPAGLRVLLAEDNPVNALLARALLTRAGCVVDRAATGEEALTALEKAPYDLVLMDMRMPGMDGLTAARILRRRGDRTPIVALTANAFEDDRRACLESGMNDFLTKPLEPKALQTALARWTRGARTGDV